ncbi:MAG: helix-turn-helix transcriptional regulator [Candidatus Thorarchaeota archaeon]
MKGYKSHRYIIFIFLSTILGIQLFALNLAIIDISSNNDFKNFNVVNQSILNPNQKYFLNYNEDFTKIDSTLTISIQSNTWDATITNDLTYQYLGNDSLNYIIHVANIETILTESRVSSFNVYDIYGPLLFTWNAYSNFDLLNITARTPLSTNDYFSFTIFYVLENAILDNLDVSGNYIFQWSYTHHEYCEQFSCVVSLPTKHELYNSTLVPSLDPDPTYISIDETRFEWDYYNVLESSTNTWIVRFKPYQENANPENVIPPFIWILMVVLFILGGGIGSISVYFILKSRINMERSEIVDTLLSQPEKEIIKIIKDEGRVTTQSKICSISGFSKAKVSYYINELEKKEVIIRERFGRMNRIRLVDESFN